jgi:hypothetical protein
VTTYKKRSVTEDVPPMDENNTFSPAEMIVLSEIVIFLKKKGILPKSLRSLQRKLHTAIAQSDDESRGMDNGCRWRRAHLEEHEAQDGDCLELRRT